MATHGECSSRVSKPRWYMPTPGKFVALLLFGVVALYLSDQYDWFAFNKQKGWTVLIAATNVAAGLVVLVVWVAAAYLFGRRAQFGLFTLSLIVTVVALPCAWLAREIRGAKQLAQEIGQLEQAGGTAYFDYRPVWVEGKFSEFHYSDTNTHSRLRAIFGDAFFGDVLYVVLADRCRFEMLTKFKQLRRVSVRNGVKVSDENLLLLANFPEFESIWVTDSDITDAGLRTLGNISTLKNVEILSSNADPQRCEAFEKSFSFWGHSLVMPRDRDDVAFMRTMLKNDSPGFAAEKTTEQLEAELKDVEAQLKELEQRRSQLRAKSQ